MHAYGNKAWRAGQLDVDGSWVHVLDASELEELDAALAAGTACAKPWNMLRAEDFPLPRLATTLGRLSDELEHGLGVVRIDGLPVTRYGEEQLVYLFWGLAQHLGVCVPQSDAGELIMNIKDAGLDPENLDVRGVHSSGRLQYHTDLCDVVGILSIHAAQRGGESLLISTIAVYQHIAATRPDVLEVLSRDFFYAKPSWDAPGQKLLESRPVFALCEGRFVSTYLREFIEWAQDDERAPRLSAVQVEALDYLDDVCNDPIFTYSKLLEPGQMLFFNSFVTYHSRTLFENSEDSANHRSLLRLWLSMPNSRRLPESYRSSYGEVLPGVVRGGIHPTVGSGACADVAPAEPTA